LAENVNPYREKLLGVGYIRRRGGSRVTQGKDEKGQRYQVTTDELGNKVRERQDGQDVRISAPHLRAGIQVNEER